jgi:hypothetical protein
VKAFDISAVDAADVKQLDALFTLAPNKGPVRFGASFCLPSCCSASQKGSVMSASDQTHRDIRLRIARVVSLLEPIAQAQGPIIDPRDTYLSITLIVTELEAVLRKMRRDIFGHTNGNGDNGAMPHGAGV